MPTVVTNPNKTANFTRIRYFHSKNKSALLQVPGCLSVNGETRAIRRIHTINASNLKMSHTKYSASTHVGCIALQHRASLVDRVLASSPSSPAAPPWQGIQSVLHDLLHCLPSAGSSGSAGPRSSPNTPSTPSPRHSSADGDPSVLCYLLGDLCGALQYYAAGSGTTSSPTSPTTPSSTLKN